MLMFEVIQAAFELMMCDEPATLVYREQRMTSHPPNHTTSTGPQSGKGLGKLHGSKAVTGAVSQEYLKQGYWLASCTSKQSPCTYRSLLFSYLFPMERHQFPRIRLVQAFLFEILCSTIVKA